MDLLIESLNFIDYIIWLDILKIKNDRIENWGLYASGVLYVSFTNKKWLFAI